MKLQERKRIMDRLGVLVQEPMRFIFRSMDMICLEFGDLVCKKVFGRDGAGEPALVDEEGGRLVLHIQCCFRMFCGGTVVLGKGDMVMPNAVLAEDPAYDPAVFDWSVNGNNRLDEILSERFIKPQGYIVAAVFVSSKGDLRIRFENGFVLEVFTDFSEEECWRFFEVDSDLAHLVVGGKGLMEE